MAKPVKEKSKYKPTISQQRAVIAFAVQQKCVIHPRGMDYYIEGFNEFGHCVCDKSRLCCPCDQAAQEIQDKGHCLCQLFWRDYGTYIIAKSL
jgi:hypothetical protein